MPVIFFNREPVEEDLRRWEYAFYVGLPAGDAGVLQGELVLDAWQNHREKIDRSGDGVIQYVMLEGEPGHQDALLRTEYCISTLAKAGVSTEKLASDAANWQRGQASVSMRQWLQEFGENIEVVFANNDDMALGAIDACSEAGLDKRSIMRPAANKIPALSVSLVAPPCFLRTSNPLRASIPCPLFLRNSLIL